MNELSLLKNTELNRHDLLAVSNLANKLTTKNIKAYIFSLLNYDPETVTSTFTLGELEKFAGGRYITNDIANVIEKNTGLKFIIHDEEFAKELSIPTGKTPKGRALGIALSTLVTYNDGEFTVYWNEKFAPYMFGDGENYTLVDYEVARELDGRSFGLYEYLLMETKEGNHTVSLSIDDLRNKLKATSKTYAQYKHLNNNVLKKASQSLLEKSNIMINYETIQEGKKVVGVQFSIARNPNFDGKLTYKQFDHLSAFKVQYEKLLLSATTEEEKAIYENILLRLKDIPMLTKNQADATMKMLVKRKKDHSFIEKGLEVQEELLECERGRYDYLLNRHFHLPISESAKKEFENTLYHFDEYEREELCKLALDYVNHGGSNVTDFNYVIVMVKRWKENGIKTVIEAENYQRTYFPDHSERVDRERHPIQVSQDLIDAMSMWS